MWAEFEWENKVAVNTDITDVAAFLEHVLTTTNMRCLTPPSALEGDSGFLAANLYAKSIFGEDALVNVSVEKRQGGKLIGYIRIRSKTQACCAPPPRSPRACLRRDARRLVDPPRLT